jgi:chromosome segregation ATPase
MKLAALAVSLLVAVVAAVGSLLSQTSRSTVASDLLVLELSQKIQDQEAKLSKTEEALRQLSSESSELVSNAADRTPQLSRVSNLQTKMQHVDSEDYRLSLLHEQISKEQARIDAWQKQSDLTKHRLDQDEKVLGLEVMVKAVDDRPERPPGARRT